MVLKRILLLALILALAAAAAGAEENIPVGTELAPFGESDLTFSGITYTELQPDILPGIPESELIDNEDGSWLLVRDGREELRGEASRIRNGVMTRISAEGGSVPL